VNCAVKGNPFYPRFDSLEIIDVDGEESKIVCVSVIEKVHARLQSDDMDNVG
jgi:hypothetical protein